MAFFVQKISHFLHKTVHFCSKKDILKILDKRKTLEKSMVYMVAGEGFEPTTQGL